MDKACHSERSEESHRINKLQILHIVQDDKPEASYENIKVKADRNPSQREFVKGGEPEQQEEASTIIPSPIGAGDVTKEVER